MNSTEKQEVIDVLIERAKKMSSSAPMCHALFSLYRNDPTLSIAKIVEFILDQHDSVFDIYKEMIRLQRSHKVTISLQEDKDDEEFMDRFKHKTEEHLGSGFGPIGPL